ADNLTRRRYQFPSGVRNFLALFLQISVEKLLVVPARNEADLLRIGLFEEAQTGTLRFLANIGLAHLAQRKQRAAQLLLRKAEEKIRLVLAVVGGPLQKPATALLVELIAGIVARGQQLRPNLTRGNQQLIELQMVIAQAARNRRAARKIV